MQHPLIEQFKAFYADLSTFEASALHTLYSTDVLFKDPVHEIRGSDSLENYMTALCKDVNHCTFEYLDVMQSEQAAYIKWLMHFEHPKLGTKRITVAGISHIQFDKQVYFHEDSYDMGAMLYEHIPLLGAATRWIKTRLEHS